MDRIQNVYVYNFREGTKKGLKTGIGKLCRPSAQIAVLKLTPVHVTAWTAPPL